MFRQVVALRWAEGTSPESKSNTTEYQTGRDDSSRRHLDHEGHHISGPLIGEAGTVSATLDLTRIAAGRRMFDPTGHYARPDVLTLTISEPQH